MPANKRCNKINARSKSVKRCSDNELPAHDAQGKQQSTPMNRCQYMARAAANDTTTSNHCSAKPRGAPQSNDQGDTQRTQRTGGQQTNKDDETSRADVRSTLFSGSAIDQAYQARSQTEGRSHGHNRRINTIKKSAKRPAGRQG